MFPTSPRTHHPGNVSDAVVVDAWPQRAVGWSPQPDISDTLNASGSARDPSNAPRGAGQEPP